MFIENTNGRVEVLGKDVEQQEMKIKIDPKAFSMMIDGLYQDKFGAVVQELSSNAYDAHVEAGKAEIPFTITLPTEFGGKFIISDQGNGLTKAQLIKFFGTLFETNKDKSNKFLGAYGLGCKSPFAVVDEFSVASVRNGIKTLVVFAREIGDTPTFFVLSETKTDEPNGTTITIDNDSVYDWEAAIRKKLQFFPVKPNIIGGSGKELFLDSTQIADITILPYCRSDAKAFIAMGPVIYPLPTELSDEILKTNNAVVYSCNIGDIKVPPDRERIYTTDQNLSFLRKLINTQNDSYRKELNRVILDKYDGTFDSYTKLKTLCLDLPGAYDILSTQLTQNIIPEEMMQQLIECGMMSHNSLTHLLTNVFYSSEVFKNNVPRYNTSSMKINATRRYPSFSSILLEDETKIVISSNMNVFDLPAHAPGSASIYYMKTKKKYIKLMYDAMMLICDYLGVDRNKVICKEIEFAQKKATTASSKSLQAAKFVYTMGEFGNFKQITGKHLESFLSGEYYLTSFDKNKYPTNVSAKMNEQLKQFIKKPIFYVSESKYNKMMDRDIPSRNINKNMTDDILNDAETVYNIFVSSNSNTVIKLLINLRSRDYRRILSAGVSNIADIYMKLLTGNSYYDICAITGINTDPIARSTMKDIKFNTPEEIKGVISKIVISQI